ncbi:MAG: hypothetical protein WCU88_07030 [Elusimicrobiota bacterium]|jgi:hypothetical protein
MNVKAFCFFFAAGLPVFAGAAEVLGVPDSVPWKSEGKAAAPQRPAPKDARKSLEVREQWESLRRDCAAVELSRDELFKALRLAKSRREIFEPQSAGLYEEYAFWAQRLWLYAADHDQALESVVGRRRAFPSPSDPALSGAGLQVAAAARLAQWRWRKEWAGLLRRNPELARSLDQAEAVGFPKGLHERRKAAIPDAGLRIVASVLSQEDGGSLIRLLGSAGAGSWRKRRAEDLAGMGLGTGVLRRAGQQKPSAERVQEALAVDERFISAPDAGIRVFARARQEPVVKRSTAPSAADDFGSAWIDMAVSSQIAVVVRKIQENLDPEPPSGPRPQSLISVSQLRGLSPLLQPGDILLVRREASIPAVGCGGWWRTALLYVGGPKSELLALDGSGSWRLPLEELAADALAVLRPRLGASERSQAVLSAEAEVAASLSKPSPSTALVWSAYGQAGFSLPLRQVPDQGIACADSLARAYDEEYGTSKERLDLLVFLDSQELRQRAEPAGEEIFRASWRRSAWTLSAAADTILPQAKETQP